MHWRSLAVEGARGEGRALQRLDDPTPDRFVPASEQPDSAHWNVARAYAALAQDLIRGTLVAPGFGEATACHRLIAAIQAAAWTGHTQTLGKDPS